jgi:hypothetical protein
MDLKFLFHFNIVKQVNALIDVYNENILLMSEKNVGIHPVLIVIQKFYHICS